MGRVSDVPTLEEQGNFGAPKTMIMNLLIIQTSQHGAGCCGNWPGSHMEAAARPASHGFQQRGWLFADTALLLMGLCLFRWAPAPLCHFTASCSPSPMGAANAPPPPVLARMLVTVSFQWDVNHLAFLTQVRRNSLGPRQSTREICLDGQFQD